MCTYILGNHLYGPAQRLEITRGLFAEINAPGGRSTFFHQSSGCFYWVFGL